MILFQCFIKNIKKSSMLWLKDFLLSSVGKKQLMAFLGCGLNGFLLVHLLGNCLAFVDGQTFNLYAHTLISSPLIYLAEALLLLFFVGHIFLGAKLFLENRSARPIAYFMVRRTGRGATWSSRAMPYSGFLILLYIVFHIVNFKYGAKYFNIVDGVVIRDLYRLLLETYADPLFLIIYLLSMVVIFFHLFHGVPSIFASVGICHPKYDRAINVGSKVYVVIVVAMYGFIPIWYWGQ